MQKTVWCGVVGLALLCLAARAEEPATSTAPIRREIVRGRAVPSVRSLAKPEQSYALYVPADYVAERRWPIVYVFDPGAQGMRPLELIQHAAERHGYLVAASHNSRNGPWSVSREAAIEIWNDTHRFLAIDDRRVYFAGFSGGARVAAALAQSCHCARGVFLVGAGFNTGTPPSRDAIFSVLALTGLADFNYGELVELDAQLERLGFPHALRRFDGEHAWAPAAEWDVALAWSALGEMRDGVRSRDDAFVAAELAQALARGLRHEQAGEAALALAEYRAAAAVLTGLTDTKALGARIDALRQDPSVRAFGEREAAEIARQRSLEAEVLAALDALRDAGADQISLRADATWRIRRLRGELEGEKSPERRRVFQRAVGRVYVGAMETGRQLADAGTARRATSLFELAVEARPDQPWPHLALARCHAAVSDEKAALRELQRAVAQGLTASRLAASVETDAKLAPLARNEDYRKLLASAPAERPAP
jgi:hypothetical protein